MFANLQDSNPKQRAQHRSVLHIYAPRHPLALIGRCCHLDILHTLQVISFSMYTHHCTFSCRGGVTQIGIITVAKCSQNLQKNLWRVDAEMCVSTASWSSTVALVRMFRVPSNLTSSECPSLPQLCQHNKLKQALTSQWRLFSCLPLQTTSSAALRCRCP